MSIQDIVEDVDRFRAGGAKVAIATVVRTWGSGPRGPGAKMALTADARITGSVSGGCVEAAVVEEGKEVLETGRAKLLRFGVSDETAWDVGLSCGGTIEVFVEALSDDDYQAIRSAVVDERAVARVIALDGADMGRSVVVSDGSDVEDDDVFDAVGREALAAGTSRQRTLEDGTNVFVDVQLPPPVLVMVGGVHVAITLTSMANALGFRTVLVDPRGIFASEERFPHVSKLVREWPDDALRALRLNRSSAVATLTHDPKLDDPALEVAVPSDAFYVGALGSKRTHEKRRRRLVERGVSEDALARIHAPIGLSIGSRSPEEIALSVMAQIVATRNGANP